tara:strand:+ start:9251 stop:9937 length:687 start_codon:yes stop_codon:yes gene_type:complete
MANLAPYYRKLVGGNITYPKTKMRPGQVVSFKYSTGKIQQKASSRRVPRLVFILNTNDSRKQSKLIHGISLEHIPWMQFKNFMQKILIHDTLTLIKRRYEIRGPFDEIIERPLTYYQNYIKSGILNWDCYRTYEFIGINNLKLWALDYRALYPSSHIESRSQLINNTDTIRTIQKETRILNEVINLKTNRHINDSRYRSLILERFGSVENFAKAADDIEDYIDQTDEK